MVLLKIKMAYQLGLINVYYVILHRIKIKMRYTATQYTHVIPGETQFFIESVTNKRQLAASENWQESALYFGWWLRPLIDDEPPDWHLNPMNGESTPTDSPWWKMADFQSGIRDIKLVWEASRFDWALVYAQRIAQGDKKALTRLNDWIMDWSLKNPPFFGANWKCGQEASIRVLHLAMTSLILGQETNPQPGIIYFIKLHLQRIASTIRYAIAQDNNHGTSEAAALFVGGSWLSSQGFAVGVKWERLGRKWLENRVSRLIGVDGSFSQYSVNYHRMVLDTFSIIELWRRRLALPYFSIRLRSRLIAASQWLATVVDPLTGNAPNIGANDGARLLPLTDTFRDFRPSVQLATILFSGSRAYERDGNWNIPLCWFDINLPESIVPPTSSQVFDDGGYAILKNQYAMALLRYPRFRFRPSQADALHVDLWKGGVNLLRDAGTYSYNAESEFSHYFSSTKSHNTVEFDDRDQMPRLGRFLWGDWLKTESIEPLAENTESASFAAAYRDSQGVYHKRHLTLIATKLQVLDEIAGFKQKAVLRWRLAPGDWRIIGFSVTNQIDRLNIQASMPIIRMQLVTGWESLYYLQKKEVLVLEVEVEQSGTIVSEYEWMLF